jgi:hypothetical protein
MVCIRLAPSSSQVKLLITNNEFRVVQRATEQSKQEKTTTRQTVASRAMNFMPFEEFLSRANQPRGGSLVLLNFPLRAALKQLLLLRIDKAKKIP